ncbi:MAG: ferritin-like domain-containing protein [Alphaproteobacteria bacterium]|nr:MAG: ferritin-like domain-containing protein [Alphaproteobacteria bacterium]
MGDWQTLGEAAVAVLMTAEAQDKAAMARKVAAAWRAGALAHACDTTPPDRPARPARPELLSPAEMPKRRKAGTEGNRKALLHAVAHIELNAIDLAFDMVARFGTGMPRAFADDWVGVGDDEARHFSMLAKRLEAFDCIYGDLPAHDGLWQSALETRHSLPARLAIVPMVLEARGLDVTPQMIAQLRHVGDDASADMLQIIYEEEIGHVGAGTRWFRHLAHHEDVDAESWFQEQVQNYFRGALKRPFNEPARNKAGMPVSFYEPLADMLKAG